MQTYIKSWVVFQRGHLPKQDTLLTSPDLHIFFHISQKSLFSPNATWNFSHNISLHIVQWLSCDNLISHSVCSYGLQMRHNSSSSAFCSLAKNSWRRLTVDFTMYNACKSENISRGWKVRLIFKAAFICQSPCSSTVTLWLTTQSLLQPDKWRYLQ